MSSLDKVVGWENLTSIQKMFVFFPFVFSGIDFQGATVGLAYIGTLCSGHSVGVVQVSLWTTLQLNMVGCARSSLNTKHTLADTWSIKYWLQLEHQMSKRIAQFMWSQKTKKSFECVHMNYAVEYACENKTLQILTRIIDMQTFQTYSVDSCSTLWNSKQSKNSSNSWLLSIITNSSHLAQNPPK